MEIYDFRFIFDWSLLPRGLIWVFKVDSRSFYPMKSKIYLYRLECVAFVCKQNLS